MCKCVVYAACTSIVPKTVPKHCASLTLHQASTCVNTGGVRGCGGGAGGVVNLCNLSGKLHHAVLCCAVLCCAVLCCAMFSSQDQVQ